MQIFLCAHAVCAAALSKYYSQPVFDKRTFERRIMELNAIILAGGEGTRLKSVTGDLPKPMVQLCGKPRPWDGAREKAANEFFKTTLDTTGEKEYTGRLK